MHVKGIFEKLGTLEARMKNPLALAYVGDTVFDLYLRTAFVKKSDEHVNELNKRTSDVVNAHAQAEAMKAILPLLSEEEEEVFRRGRNAKIHSSPKNMSISDYKLATGLEALVGYLFLTGRNDRVEELMQVVFDTYGV